MTALSHASPHPLWGQQLPRCSFNSQNVFFSVLKKKVCFSPRLPADKPVGACVCREQIQYLAKQVCESGLDSFFELMKWEQERNEMGKEPRKVQTLTGSRPGSFAATLKTS